MIARMSIFFEREAAVKGGFAAAQRFTLDGPDRVKHNNPSEQGRTSKCVSYVPGRLSAMSPGYTLDPRIHLKSYSPSDGLPGQARQ